MSKHIAILFALVVVLTDCRAASDNEIVAATLILEAGGEYEAGALQGVMEVIRNRAVKRSLTVADVCLQRLQFSCWNTDRAGQLAKAKRHPRWSEAMAIVLGPPTNFTGGADHYHADYVSPYWAESMTVTAKIGRHIFYR